jgi:hypothetical protein
MITHDLRRNASQRLKLPKLGFSRSAEPMGVVYTREWNPTSLLKSQRTHPPTFRWWVAFSLLILTIHEAHELAHVLTGKAVCGMWAARDFNSWWFTGECNSVLPTTAGPIFSYVVMFVGAALAFRAKPVYRWAGVALLFSANPFARIFTSVMGGGDEMVVGRRIADVANRTTTLHILVAVIVATICGAAILMGWRAMEGLKHRALWFVGVLFWPMILTGTLLFVIGNRLLRAGFLAQPTIAGAPLLVALVTVVVFVLTGMTVRWLSSE